jgi:hypothetical protein
VSLQHGTPRRGDLTLTRWHLARRERASTGAGQRRGRRQSRLCLHRVATPRSSAQGAQQPSHGPNGMHEARWRRGSSPCHPRGDRARPPDRARVETRLARGPLAQFKHDTLGAAYDAGQPPGRGRSERVIKHGWRTISTLARRDASLEGGNPAGRRENSRAARVCVFGGLRVDSWVRSGCHVCWHYVRRCFCGINVVQWWKGLSETTARGRATVTCPAARRLSCARSGRPASHGGLG